MYDARSNTLGGDSNMVFGALTLVIVVVCFFGVLVGPSLFSREAPTPVVEVEDPAVTLAELSNPDALVEALTDPDEARFLADLYALSPDAYMDLQRVFSEEEMTEDEQMGAVQAAAMTVVSEHARFIALAQPNDIDSLMRDLTVDLRKAAQSGSKYCLGQTYADMQGLSPDQITAQLARDNLENDAFYPTAMRINADLLGMARKSLVQPVRRGPISRQDEVELQRALMAVMADPAVVRVMMASGDREAALNALNMCEVGVTTLQALREMPADTKARAWAAIFQNQDFKDALTSAAS